MATTSGDESKAIRRLVGIVLTMDADGAVKGAELAGDALDKLDQRAKGAAKGFDGSMRLLMGAGTAIAGALGYAFGLRGLGGQMLAGVGANIDAAKRFQVELKKLQFVTQASETQMKDLHDLAIQTGLDTMFDPEEAVQAMQMLAQYGLQLKDVQATLADTLNFVGASGGEIDLGVGTQVTGNLMTKFQLDADKLGGSLDKLAMAAIKSNMSFQDFLPYMNSLGASVTKTKASVEDIFAIGGAMRNSGQLAAQSGQSFNGFVRTMTGLQVALARAQMKGKAGAGLKEDMQALKDLGISMEDIDLTRPVELLAKMADGLERINGKDAAETQKKRAKVMQVLLGDQSSAVLAAASSLKVLNEETGQTLLAGDALKYLRDQIKNAAGVTDEASDSMLETLAQQEKQLEGSIATLKIVAGELLIPIWTEVVTQATAGLNVLLALAMRFPQVTKFALFATIAMGGLMVVTGTAAIAFLTLTGTVLGASVALVEFIGWLSAAGLLEAAVFWPLTLVLGIAALAVLTFAAAVATLVGGTVGALWLAWVANLGGFQQRIMGWVNALSLAADVLGEFWDDFKAPKELVDSLMETSPTLAKLVLGILGLKYRLSELFAGMRESGAWKVIAAGAELVGEAFLTLVDWGFRALAAIADFLGYAGKGKEWRVIGNILMWVILVLGAFAVAASVAVLAVLGFMWAVSNLVLILAAVGAGISAALVTAFLFIQYKIHQFGQWLGQQAVVFGTIARTWITALWLGFQVGWALFKAWLTTEISALQQQAVGALTSFLPAPVAALIPGVAGSPTPSSTAAASAAAPTPASAAARPAQTTSTNTSTAYSLGGVVLNIQGAGDKAEVVAEKVLSLLQQRFDDAAAGAF